MSLSKSESNYMSLSNSAPDHRHDGVHCKTQKDPQQAVRLQSTTRVHLLAFNSSLRSSSWASWSRSLLVVTGRASLWQRKCSVYWRNCPEKVLHLSTPLGDSAWSHLPHLHLSTWDRVPLNSTFSQHRRWTPGQAAGCICIMTHLHTPTTNQHTFRTSFLSR